MLLTTRVTLTLAATMGRWPPDCRLQFASCLWPPSSISMAIWGLLCFLPISECKCVCKEAAFLFFYCGFGVFSTREPPSSVGVLTLGGF